MQYPVPQFIERETRIVGLLSLKQALFLGVAAGLCLLFWAILPTAAAIVMILLVAILAVGLAFWKPGGRPLSDVIVSAIKHLVSTRQYLWRKSETPQDFPIISSQPYKKEEVKTHEDDQALMELSPRSRLEKLKSRIETS